MSDAKALKQEIKDRFVWQDPVLDENGAEVISPVTLVSVADLRPIMMKERVQRYMRLPQFAEDQKLLQDLWKDPDLDENIDLDEVPLSEYEDRAREMAVRVQARRAKEAKEASERKAQEDKEAFEAWSRKYEEIKQKGSAPLPPPPPAGTPSDAEAGPSE